MDENGDGKISLYEYKREYFSRACKYQTPPKEAFAEIDKNKSGSLTLAEYTPYWY